MATAIMLVDFHLHHIKKLLEVEEIQEELAKDTWKSLGSPLHIAAAVGRTEIMKLIIEAGGNVNCHASGLGSWMTPLHQAALAGQIEAAELLLEHGADPEERGFRDALKGTPLDFAKHENEKKMIELLEKHTDTPPKYSEAVRRNSVGSAAASNRSKIPTGTFKRNASLSRK